MMQTSMLFNRGIISKGLAAKQGIFMLNLNLIGATAFI
jgi:hypothetical protein